MFLQPKFFADVFHFWRFLRKIQRIPWLLSSKNQEAFLSYLILVGHSLQIFVWIAQYRVGNQWNLGIVNFWELFLFQYSFILKRWCILVHKIAHYHSLCCCILPSFSPSSLPEILLSLLQRLLLQNFQWQLFWLS